jgi:thioredoxin reductase
METFASFLAAFLVTFFFVRRYVKGLMASKRPSAQQGEPVKKVPCPRCGQGVPEKASFCGACGAPMSLWNVHRAAVQEKTETPGDKGRPRPVINASLCIGCGSCVDACPETGTLEVRGGKAILAHAERCVGHAKCVTACPTSAIAVAYGNTRQTLKVPSVNENFETNVQGVFIVGELGGLGLIKTAINEGKMAIEHVRRKLEAQGLWTPPVVEHDHDENAPAVASTATQGEAVPANGMYDVIIAGAGPAGLSASLAAQQCGLKYLTVEQGEIASTIRNYPRHKFLMAEPVEMPLYGSLYIGDSTKEGLLSVWEAILSNTGVRVNTGEKIEAISREKEGFMVKTSRGTHAGRYVVLALGKRGSPRRMNVPGEELSKVAYRLIEAETYLDNDILVVGGGDSAVEAALAVSKGKRNRVTLSYRGGDFSRLRERNLRQLEEAEASGRFQVVRNSQVVEITPDIVKLSVKGGETMQLKNDYVFVLIGGESPEDFLRRTGVEIVEKVLEAT